MRFCNHKTYTHKRMLDVAIYVTKTQFVGLKYSKVRIRWINKKGMDIGVVETIKIKKEEYKNWYEINV